MNTRPSALGRLAWRQIDKAGPPPRRLVRAEGIYLYYDDGTRLIDASGGPICVGVGHGRPEIIQAMTDQLKILYLRLGL